MIVFGTHLAHGFWSAITSLSLNRSRFSDPFHIFSIIFAIMMATGFLFIPLYIYFPGGEGILISQ